ncbi:MAG: hypothetical protein M3Z17_08385, partial [Gemmatimonadota bacterium]|nr:hypothetical protein [Gemmatimonadota bacterium]
MKRSMNSHCLATPSLALALLTACARHDDDSARSQLASILSDSLGKSADAMPSFLKDSTHLQIDVSSNAFSELDESA